MAPVAWLKGYLQGSFRGVDFYIKNHRYTSGRRQDEHVFPGRDDAAYDDQGQLPVGFKMPTMYVIDNDYFSLRDALMTALNTKGPGKLVHPYLGIFQVNVFGEFSMSEDQDEMNMARFNVNFREDKGDNLTIATTNTKQQLATASDNLNAATTEQFIDTYSVDTASNSGVRDAAKGVSGAITAMEGAKKIAESKAEYQRKVANLRGNVIAYSLNAQDLVQELQPTLDFGNDPFNPAEPLTFDSAKESFNEMKELIFSISQPVTDTPASVSSRPDYPSRQIQIMTALLSAGSAVSVVSLIPYGTIEEAQDIQNSLFEIFDTLLADESMTDVVIAAIQDAKAAVVDDIDQRIRDLAQIVEYSIPTTRPTLRIVNDIYGNLETEDEIIARNKIIHPMFVSPVDPIQVPING